MQHVRILLAPCARDAVRGMKLRADIPTRSARLLQLQHRHLAHALWRRWMRRQRARALSRYAGRELRGEIVRRVEMVQRRVGSLHLLLHGEHVARERTRQGRDGRCVVGANVGRSIPFA